MSSEIVFWLVAFPVHFLGCFMLSGITLCFCCIPVSRVGFSGFRRSRFDVVGVWGSFFDFVGFKGSLFDFVGLGGALSPLSLLLRLGERDFQSFSWRYVASFWISTLRISHLELSLSTVYCSCLDLPLSVVCLLKISLLRLLRLLLR